MDGGASASESGDGVTPGGGRGAFFFWGGLLWLCGKPHLGLGGILPRDVNTLTYGFSIEPLVFKLLAGGSCCLLGL